jgi:hypothetical protein
MITDGGGTAIGRQADETEKYALLTGLTGHSSGLGADIRTMAPKREPLRRHLNRVSSELDRMIEVRVRRPLNSEEQRRYVELLAMERLLSVMTVEL